MAIYNLFEALYAIMAIYNFFKSSIRHYGDLQLFWSDLLGRLPFSTVMQATRM